MSFTCQKRDTFLKKWLLRAKKFEERIEYHFKKRDLLQQALSHPSSFPEQDKECPGKYESMEFLGDAILGFLVSEMIYKQGVSASEGDMSRMKAHLVSAKNLAVEAKKLEVGQLLIMGKGEEKTGGRKKESILAATMETIIAAIYLDGGMKAARAWVKKMFAKKIEAFLSSSENQDLFGADSKSALQEFLQKRKEPLPNYVIVREEGPSHEKKFFVEIRYGGRTIARGSGRSKKEAEQQAAKRALAKMKSQ